MSRTHYLAELESVRRNLVEMGVTTLALFDEAIGTLPAPNADRLAKASELEAKTDHRFHCEPRAPLADTVDRCQSRRAIHSKDVNTLAR